MVIDEFLKKERWESINPLAVLFEKSKQKPASGARSLELATNLCKTRVSYWGL